MEKKLTEIKVSLIKKFQLIAGVSVLAFIASSCDVFQKEPLSNINPSKVWGDSVITEAYLNNLYHVIMPGFSGTTNSRNSDESIGAASEINNTLYGLLTKESESYFSNTTYGNIRRINLLLQNIGTGSFPESFEQKIKGQAHFLRAWIYWSLVRLYGGVPMIMSVSQSVVDGDIPEYLFVKRNTTRECIELICADLDSAFQYLPPRWNDANYGRITRGAAIAMKGRILLFWASPQFNPDNKPERWQWAYDVNSQALDVLTQDGHGLHSSFTDLFTNCRERTVEAILVRTYDNSANNSAYYHNYDRDVRPAYMGASGGGTANHPTWDLVAAFPMIDGYPIDVDSLEYPFNNNNRTSRYNQKLFWLNRDPRFAVTIAYNTCSWPLSGISSYKLWTYYYWTTENGQPVLRSNEGNSYTRTGFYCRKYVNPAISSDNSDNVGTDWMEIRFAEVLLNFAECANELSNKTDDVRYTLNRIRTERADVQAGMGYIDANISNQTVMREIIMNERQIELAFENKRYWDLRRRNLFENDLGPHVKKLNGTKRCGWKTEFHDTNGTHNVFLSIRNGINFNTIPSYNAYFRNERPDTLDTQSPINYPQPKYNFFAIPQTNLDKNPNLEQTNYWGGTFDPLAE